MTYVDAREIHKQILETVQDIPHQFRSQFRMDAETLQSAREFEDPIIQKGAETAIATNSGKGDPENLLMAYNLHLCKA